MMRLFTILPFALITSLNVHAFAPEFKHFKCSILTTLVIKEKVINNKQEFNPYKHDADNGPDDQYIDIGERKRLKVSFMSQQQYSPMEGFSTLRPSLKTHAVVSFGNIKVGTNFTMTPDSGRVSSSDRKFSKRAVYGEDSLGITLTCQNMSKKGPVVKKQPVKNPGPMDPDTFHP